MNLTTLSRRSGLALAALVLAAAWGTPRPAQATPGEVRVGQTLRDPTMRGLLGPSRKLSAFRGKPLLINVWASWCGPCRAEMGSLQRLHARYGGKQFHVIGISTDDYTDRAEAFVRWSGLKFSNFIDDRLVLENMLGADRLPLTVLVDAQGTVVAKFYGAHAWDQPEMTSAISKALRVRL